MIRAVVVLCFCLLAGFFYFNNKGAKPPVSPSEDVSVTVFFAVNRAQLTKTLNDLPKLLQSAKVVPNVTPSNDIRGFKFVAVLPDSVWPGLGIQAGDIVHTLNGKPLNSPMVLMNFVNQIKDVHEVTVDLDRDGKTLRNLYKIQ